MYRAVNTDRLITIDQGDESQSWEEEFLVDDSVSCLVPAPRLASNSGRLTLSSDQGFIRVSGCLAETTCWLSRGILPGAVIPGAQETYFSSHSVCPFA